MNETSSVNKVATKTGKHLHHQQQSTHTIKYNACNDAQQQRKKYDDIQIAAKAAAAIEKKQIQNINNI